MRIRTIKPEWLDDERLVLASSDARVLSIALIILADDYGNGRANRTILAARVFPGSRDPRETLASAIETLAGAGFIDLYEVDGQSYYSIRNWAKHQKVDHPSKPQVPGKPAVSESSRNPRETLASPRESLALDQDQDQEGTSKGEERTHAPEPDQAKPGQRTHPLGSGPIVCGIDPEEVRLAYVERWEKHARGKRPPLVARGFGGQVWTDLARAFVDPETCEKILDLAFADSFVRGTGWTPNAILGAYSRLSTLDVREPAKPEPEVAREADPIVVEIRRLREEAKVVELAGDWDERDRLREQANALARMAQRGAEALKMGRPTGSVGKAAPGAAGGVQ